MSLKITSLPVAFVAALALFGVAAASAAGLKVTERKITEKKPTYEIEFAYPQVGIPAVDQAIEGWIKANVEEFRGYTKDGTLMPGQSYSGEISYTVERNDGAMFGVLFTYYTFTGGAHPNSNFTSFNFMLPDGAAVEIGDIFTRAGIERISKLSIASLNKDLVEPNDGGDTDWIAKGAAPIGKNFENFILKPNELAIYFDSYSVAAYAAGPQEVHIPLSQLRAFMRSDPRAPAASFDCAKAVTDIEQAICSSREVARLDRHVADEYFNALAWAVDEPAGNKLKNEQKAWLNERDTHCRVAAQSMTSCLSASYQARLKALQNRTE
jgi:uncharacterized protein YecT (DUF1311 family)